MRVSTLALFHLIPSHLLAQAMNGYFKRKGQGNGTERGSAATLLDARSEWSARRSAGESSTVPVAPNLSLGREKFRDDESLFDEELSPVVGIQREVSRGSPYA